MPRVSIIVPCYNEQTTIRLLLEAIAAQTYPHRELEVIIADGRSTDRTRAEIAAFQRAHPDLCVYLVDNPMRIIPCGLNRALAAATGEIIVRMDAHAVPHPEYVERCVAALDQGLAENVGGVWDIRPGGTGWQARAIAVAARLPIAVGDAFYRYTAQAAIVDTVPFGAFRRELIAQVGAFDETLPINEDYEFNTRIRAHGGRIWLDPAIRSVYFARATLAGLARQYWRYGYWKLRMLRRYPASARWRQALPPLFVLSLLVLAILAPWLPLARIALGGELAIYTLVLVLVAAQVTYQQRSPVFLVGIPLAIATMHTTWGGGFLWGVLDQVVLKRGVEAGRRPSSSYKTRFKPTLQFRQKRGVGGAAPPDKPTRTL